MPVDHCLRGIIDADENTREFLSFLARANDDGLAGELEPPFGQGRGASEKVGFRKPFRKLRPWQLCEMILNGTSSGDFNVGK